jgi:ribose/xylose/arabinose/galactoside ABC-type transport system permease subunit
MRLERIILTLAVILMAAGCLTWLLGGADALPSLGIWFWFGAFGVLSLPLIGRLVHFFVKRGRD